MGGLRIMLNKIGKIFSLAGRDMAIDLGTANTLIYIKGEGIVLNEPSVVMVTERDGDVIAVGAEAKSMVGRTPDTIRTIRPMKDGVIADFKIAEEMLRYFISKARNGRGFIKPKIAVCVPSGITEVEKRAVRDSAEHAGAREVLLIQEPMSAAIGADLPIHTPTGNIVVDIGGGTTEVAVISLDGIVASNSIRVAGDEINEAIDQYLKKAYNLLVGEQTAEQIKLQIGTAYTLDEEESMTVKGRDLVAGIPKTQKITSRELREAIKEPVNGIVNVVLQTLEQTPPELSADIVDRGVTLCGGGALLRGIDRLLNKETNLPIRVVENALTCIVEGTGRALDDMERYGKIFI
jgi:rod shape-determining protein MreB